MAFIWFVIVWISSHGWWTLLVWVTARKYGRVKARGVGWVGGALRTYPAVPYISFKMAPLITCRLLLTPPPKGVTVT